MALVIRKRVMDRIRLGGYRTAKIKEPFRRDGRARVRHMPRADARQPFRPPSVRWDRGIRPAMMKSGLGMATSYWLGAQKSTTGAACALAVMLAMPTRRPAASAAGRGKPYRRFGVCGRRFAACADTRLEGSNSVGRPRPLSARRAARSLRHDRGRTVGGAGKRRGPWRRPISCPRHEYSALRAQQHCALGGDGGPQIVEQFGAGRRIRRAHRADARGQWLRFGDAQHARQAATKLNMRKIALKFAGAAFEREAEFWPGRQAVAVPVIERLDQRWD